ncbi:hypothetical protein AB0M64_02325 [Streptomyces sp. NPDC051771]|uniref:hypothetical protein n=1 Tax=Streptomyces sp. NPDC051771 TaxID=3154847 RepID=UPI003441FBD2
MKLTAHLSAEPEEIWILDVESLEMTSDEVIKELQDLTWRPGAPFPLMSSIRGRQSILNWGASSSLSEFILEMGAGGLGGLEAAGLAAAIRYTYGKFRDRSQGDPWGESIAEEVALAQAKARIVEHYGVAEDALTVRRAETNAVDKRFEFTFSHTDGRSFGAEVGVIKDAPTCMRLWREAPST